MSRYSAFLLFLVVVPWIFCAADPVDYPEYDPTPDTTTTMTTAAPTTTTTTTAPTTTTATAAPTTTTATAAPTTTTATAAPTTTTATAAPTTTTTTAAPTTTTTTAAPTTTTTAAPTTTTTAAPTTTTTAAPTTTTTAAPTTTTTAAPTTTTTAAPTTTTTAAPTTTTTSTPTTTPVPPLPKPTAHLYQVKKGNNSCLMVKFGLRIGFRGDKYEEMNFEYSNKTVVSGSCEENSTLVIQADTLNLTLTFHNDTKKFSLHVLKATGKLNSGVHFSETNSTLALWQASLGSSYMCNKEQVYNITENLKVFTFDLQVQPFEVQKDSFSTAQECSMDDTSILIPIVVGAALAGLILIVVIAYVIGRRKTYVGYQTL